MNKAFLYAVKVIILLPLLFLCSVNWKVYHQPKCATIKEGKVNREVVAQLRHLKIKLTQGAAEDMQDIYPEGYIFFHALYGLSWVEVLQTVQPASELYQEGIAAIDGALEAIFSEEGQSIFPNDLPLSYGAFYTGWSTYLLGQKLKINQAVSVDSAALLKFTVRCQAIAQAFEQSKQPYLASYHQGTWPADNILCLATLHLHDQFLDNSFGETRANWLDAIKKNLDPQTGLIPHAVNEDTKGIARGSSQALILNFLHEIDSSFARSQFELFKENFVAYRFGLPGIREYPQGTTGVGDIDSGPVIFGIGGAASIVGIKTMAIYKEWELHQALRNSVAGFGLSLGVGNRRAYLFGALPIADVFIAWANAGACQAQQEEPIDIKWTFHFYSLLLIFVLGFLAFKI